MSTSGIRTNGVAGTLIGALTFSVALVLGNSPALADDAQAPGVARISVLSGNVALKRGDSGDTVAAAANAPVLVGDYLSTDAEGRAEVQFDYANLLQLGPNAQLRFVTLNPTSNVAQLAAGTVELSVLRLTGAHPEIDTPSIAIRAAQPGRYRITVTNDGNTELTVRDGEAQVVTASGTQNVGNGTTLVASGSSDNPQLQNIDTVATDDFDSWAGQRDQQVASTLDNQNATAYTGAGDLDAYGKWVDTPDYGQVWTPDNTPQGWAPYSNGQWTWEPYYGWTWVDASAWGWAPYHYGRWFYANTYGWCWYPGPYVVRPVWQPALVAFFGFGGGGVGISIGGAFGFGNVGWVALGPGEPYHPWWGPHYNNYTNITNITNVTNVTNITNVYRNARIPGGAVAVSRTNFQNGNFSHRIAVTPEILRQGRTFNATVPVVPTKQNLALTSRPAPAFATATHFDHAFAKMPVPASLHTTSFAQQQMHVQAVTQHAYPQLQHDTTSAHEPAAAERAQPQNSSAYASRESSNAGSAGNPWDRFSNQTHGGSYSSEPYATHTTQMGSPETTHSSGALSTNGAMHESQVQTPSYAEPDRSAPAPTYHQAAQPAYGQPAHAQSYGGSNGRSYGYGSTYGYGSRTSGSGSSGGYHPSGSAPSGGGHPYGGGGGGSHPSGGGGGGGHASGGGGGGGGHGSHSR